MESTDPDAMYRAEAIRCHACWAREMKREQFRDEDADLAGVYFVAERMD